MSANAKRPATDQPVDSAAADRRAPTEHLNDRTSARRHLLAFGAAVAALFLAIYGLLPSSAPLIEPDSASYLGFAAYRTGGYPVFLDLVRGLGIGVEQLPLIQYGLYALSLGTLAAALADITDSMRFTAAVMVVFVLVQPMHELHGQVLTDSLFLTFLNGVAASLLWYSRRHRPGWLAIAATCVGVALTVRPVAWALVPLLPLAVVVLAGWRALIGGWTVAAILLPLLAFSVAERTYYAAHYGWERQSLLPLHIYAKGALMPASTMPDELPQAFPESMREPLDTLWRASSEDYAPVRRLIREARDVGFYCRLQTHYETYAQYRLAPRDAREAMGIENTRALRAIGLARIGAHPAAYLELAWSYYRCLWRFGLGDGAEGAAAYGKWIESVRPLPYEADVAAVLRAVPSRYGGLYVAIGAPVAVVMTGVAIIAGLLSVVAVFFMFTRWFGDPLIRLSAVFALGVNGYFALVALTGVATARYTLAMTVPLGLMLSLLVYALLTRLRR